MIYRCFEESIDVGEELFFVPGAASSSIRVGAEEGEDVGGCDEVAEELVPGIMRICVCPCWLFGGLFQNGLAGYEGNC